MLSTTKRCPGCSKREGHDVFLPLSAFGKCSGRSDGLGPRCTGCERARNRTKYAKARANHPAPSPSLPPLESALTAHADAKAKRDLRQENAALVEELRKARADLDASRALREPAGITVISKTPGSIGDAVPCIVASDWHVEEAVDGSKVHGINEFNLSVAEKRAQAFFRNALRLVDITARDSKVTRVWAGFLGDFFSNYIHEELREVNELPPTEAAKFAKNLLASGVDFWLRESPYSFDIDCVHGNHGRMTLKPRIQNSAETSLESFMYDALAERYRNEPRVSFRVASSKMLYRRYFQNFNMRLIHGDDVKFGGGVGGITIPIRKKLAAWDKALKADLTVMGHFHQRMDGGDFIVNGSLIGYNEFAQAIGASPEEAQQSFFLVHARGGGMKALTAPIWLTESTAKGTK